MKKCRVDKTRLSQKHRAFRSYYRFVRCFLLLLGLVVMLFFPWHSQATWAQSSLASVGVYYQGPEDIIAESIDLAYPYLVRVDQLELAQVLVLNDSALSASPQDETARLIGKQIQQGDLGLVLICGAEFPQDAADLGILLGLSTFKMRRSTDSSEVQLGDESDIIQDVMAWDSAPPLQARTIISNPNLLTPIIATQSPREPLLQRVRGREKAQVFIVGGWLGDSSNAQWQAWPYFRYLVYRLIVDAAQSPRVLSFSNYPLSPVPQGELRWSMAVLGIAMMVISGGVLFFVRRHLYLNPDLVATPRREEGNFEEGVWGQTGFQRPLAGFLTLLSLGLLCFVPLIIYNISLLPNTLLPRSQALSFWEQVGSWFEIVWLLFDLGVGVATVRYFAMLRIYDLKEAFRYFQFYVWWQLITGALQTGGVMLAAALFFPSTPLAHLSFYFVIHALIQFPGFLRVFRLFFRAIQRLDYEQGQALLLNVGGIVIQGGTVFFLSRWGAVTPGIGAALGGVLGLGLGLYLTEWVAFAVGFVYYRHLGYSLRALFFPNFDRHIAWRVLGFGARMTFGTLMVPLARFLQTLLVGDLIVDYDGMQQQWALILQFAFAYEVLLSGLYNGLLPAMVEALHQGYNTLLRYYVSQGVHYGVWFSFFSLAVLSAVADRVLWGLVGESYADLQTFIPVLLVWGALRWAAWSADRVLEAAGRPAIPAWLTLLEQALSLGLMLWLVPQLQVWGIVIPMLAAVMLHGGLAWFLAGWLVVRPRFYVWQTLFAPAGAAILVYNFIRVFGNLFWTPTPTASVVLFLVALLPTLPFYGFLTAFFGGWDAGGVAELKEAALMCGVAKPLVLILFYAVDIGAQASPLRGRYLMALRELAQEEAQALSLGSSRAKSE